MRCLKGLFTAAATLVFALAMNMVVMAATAYHIDLGEQYENTENEDEGWKWEKIGDTEYKLTFDNLNLDISEDEKTVRLPGQNAEGEPLKITVELIGDNVITGSHKNFSAFTTNSRTGEIEVTITGGGKLTVIRECDDYEDPNYTPSLIESSNLILDNADIELRGGGIMGVNIKIIDSMIKIDMENDKNYGIAAYGYLEISDSDIEILSERYTIVDYGNNGKISGSDIYSESGEKGIYGMKIEESNILDINSLGINISGYIELKENMEVESDKKLTVNADSTLYVPEDVELTIEGSVENNGVIEFEKEIDAKDINGMNIVGDGIIKSGDCVYSNDGTLISGQDEEEDKKGGSSYSLEYKDRDEKDSQEDEREESEPEEKPVFSDVAVDNPNYEAIMSAYENGYMTGISDGVFAPNGYLTRGMATVILWNMAENPEPADVSPFLDVTGDSWYAKAVAWAYEHGIILGYSETAFGPDDYVTIEQFEIMVAKFRGEAVPAYTGISPNATRGWVAGMITK